jgi:hypothetical protein
MSLNNVSEKWIELPREYPIHIIYFNINILSIVLHDLNLETLKCNLVLYDIQFAMRQKIAFQCHIVHLYFIAI